MKKLVFIVNPISGVHSKDRIPGLVEEFFNKDDFRIDILTTEYVGHACELTMKAVAAKVDYIIAVGGDGTVNEVAQNMVHSKSALGIIPAGSGNGLARDLHIPFDIRKAMGVIAKGNITQIDYCKANRRLFFCTCGFGFDASVSERFSEEKHRGVISYLKSVISEYVKFRPEEYEIILDNEVIKEKAFLLTCANASQYGYNAYIAPHANIRDGKMDVVVMSPIHPVEAGTLAIQLFAKQIDKNSKLSYYRSQKVIIKRSKPGVMHIDGTPIMAGKKITVKTIASGLNVIIPTEEDVESSMQTQIHDVQSFFQEMVHWMEGIALPNKDKSATSD